jgi:hypothetical protein
MTVVAAWDEALYYSPECSSKPSYGKILVLNLLYEAVKHKQANFKHKINTIAHASQLHSLDLNRCTNINVYEEPAKTYLFK